MRKNVNCEFKINVASVIHARYAIANIRISPRALFSLDPLSPLIYFQTFYFSSEQFRPSTCKHRRASVGEERRRKRKIEKRKILNIINLRENPITDGNCVCKDLQVARSNASGGD